MDLESQCKHHQQRWDETKNVDALGDLYLSLSNYIKAIILKREKVTPEELSEVVNTVATDVTERIQRGARYGFFGAFLSKKYKSYLYKGASMEILVGDQTEGLPDNFQMTFYSSAEVANPEDLTYLQTTYADLVTAIANCVDNSIDSVHCQPKATDIIKRMLEAMDGKPVTGQAGLTPLELEYCRFFVRKMVIQYYHFNNYNLVVNKIKESGSPYSQWILFFFNRSLDLMKNFLRQSTSIGSC